MANYTVFDNGELHHGTARLILEAIRVKAGQNSPEVADMTVDQYAETLVEDAPYFLDQNLITALDAEDLDSKVDKALTLLALMPTSGVRILTVKAA